MRDTFLRILTDDEKNLLHQMLEDKESEYRTKIILFKDEGYTVPQIRKITNHQDLTIIKWIHRFNEQSIEGITSSFVCLYDLISKINKTYAWNVVTWQ